MHIEWDEQKNQQIKSQRGVCFEDVFVAISDERLLDVLPHHNLEKYPNQKLFIVQIRSYVYYVPFVEDQEMIFLKNIIPSRKYQKKYLIDAKPFHGVVKHNCLNDTIKKDAIITLFDVQTTSDQDIIIIDFLNRQIGKKYDWWSVFGFILYTTEEGRKSYNKWFCSELIFATFNKVNISLLERAEAWKMSPTTLSYSSKLISI